MIVALPGLSTMWEIITKELMKEETPQNPKGSVFESKIVRARK